ncbi:hypothetical protein JMA_04520 [Jeotgalibacillus malaysiensis]|uniref:Uncharacterized protein n=1 Tax=Jeotgalibacillus malaysiensis TaxID=1508404 RepID=A0A0B5AP09_9BACL|nr:hypothetical protein JMA_04520 [Jeotgalibacillus malaysiensis]
MAEQIVEQKEAAGYGFSYIHSEQQQDFIWTISHSGQIVEVNENASNERNLTEYRNTIYEMSDTFSTALISGSYFVIALFVSLVFFRRHKKERNSPLTLIIGSMIGIAMYITVSNIFEYQQAYQDAGYYFSLLVNETSF